MYSDLAQIVSGFSRIFIGGLRGRVKLILTAGILLSALLPFVAAPLLATAWLAGFGDGGWLTHAEFAVLSGLCLVQLTTSTTFNARIWASGGLSLKWIVFYPLALLVALYTMAHAVVNFTRVQWRGINYKVDRRGQIVA